MQLSITVLLFFCFISIAFADNQQGSVEQGKALFKQQCAKCHGKLISRKITGSPKLENLDKSYVISRLSAYAADTKAYGDEQKNKQRMIDTAKQLSRSDIQHLAAYLATK